ncbi:MAG: DUF3347 domain-containing protein [Planctomycetes bacterium]|nr:DUF3347 domain-containing protein [Planctomycetota bacterium]
MAFGNKGAGWLQAGAKTRNPYFGPAMLACGDVMATFHSQAPLNVPDSFRAQLANLYDAYLKLQTELAADRPTESITAVQQVRMLLDKIDPSKLDERASGSWTLAKKQMADALNGDLGKLKIDTLRTRFEPLSITMLGVVDNFGHAQDAPLYKAFCPMAFGNKGAPWLQADLKIANPYFGAKMLRCGSIKRTYEAAVAEENQ